MKTKTNYISLIILIVGVVVLPSFFFLNAVNILVMYHIQSSSYGARSISVDASNEFASVGANSLTMVYVFYVIALSIAIVSLFLIFRRNASNSSKR